MKTIYVVIDELISEPDAWETHLASILQGYIDSNDIQSEYQVVEIKELSDLKSKFESATISSQDIIVFPNAWTSFTLYAKHWSEIYKIPVKTLGCWSKGCYINTDPVFRPEGNRDWRKVFERASFRCLDKSFFISEYFKEQFRIYVSKIVFPDRLKVIPFPMDYLEIETAVLTNNFFKKDIVVFPWQTYTDFHEQVMYDFIRVFKDIQVIFAQHKAPLTREQMQQQIAKAKVVFLPYDHPNLGKEIYECLLLNAIPLVPDIPGMEDFVPDEFKYPAEWTESIFKYSAFAPDLISKIRDLVENYTLYKPLLESHRQHLYEDYFDSEKIIHEIFGTINRN
jgi:hypothetical protein